MRAGWSRSEVTETLCDIIGHAHALLAQQEERKAS